MKSELQLMFRMLLLPVVFLAILACRRELSQRLDSINISVPYQPASSGRFR